MYQFKITNTDTGVVYDYFAKDETADTITESVSFDGNHAAETDVTLSQTPDTLELWFKTTASTRQTLLNNYPAPVLLLEISMRRGAGWTTVHGAGKSWT